MQYTQNTFDQKYPPISTTGFMKSPDCLVNTIPDCSKTKVLICNCMWYVLHWKRSKIKSICKGYFWQKLRRFGLWQPWWMIMMLSHNKINPSDNSECCGVTDWGLRLLHVVECKGITPSTQILVVLLSCITVHHVGITQNINISHMPENQLTNLNVFFGLKILICLSFTIPTQDRRNTKICATYHPMSHFWGWFLTFGEWVHSLEMPGHQLACRTHVCDTIFLEIVHG